MIFGECPYCDDTVIFEVPDNTPVWSHPTCEGCGKTFWEYHSRVYPLAFTEEEFVQHFVNDDKNMVVRRK